MSAFIANLSSPPLLFFFLGAFAVVARSDLEIPNQIAKFLSIYLLFAIGFKGGVALSESTLGPEVLLTLGAAMLLSAVIPIYTFFLLRKRFSVASAAAIAATYGSVSAVTFVTATSYLDVLEIDWGGHMVAAMALMESPAIITGLLLYSHFVKSGDTASRSIPWGELMREACFNGSVVLILGSMIIGFITGSEGMSQISPLITDLFLGVLCLFLLDMGIIAARRLKDAARHDHGGSHPEVPLKMMIIASVLLPLANVALALPLAWLLQLGEGDALLFLVLSASASYIAVPAAMRLVLPEANPGTYLPMSLAMTFPLNILVGIPVYHALVRGLL